MKKFIIPEMNISIFDSEKVVTQSARLEGLSNETLGENGQYAAVNLENILKYNNVDFTF